MAKIPPFLAAAGLILGSAAFSPAELPGEGQEVKFQLTILHNSDANSELLDSTSRPGFGGAAHFVQLVRNARQEAAEDGSNSLLLSAGNSIFVNPQFQVSLDAGYPFLDSKVLSAARYDGVCLANHEFAFGGNVLGNFVRPVTPRRTPFIISSVNGAREPKLTPLYRDRRISRSTILHKRGTKIGLIAVTEPLQGFTLMQGALGVDVDLPKVVRKEVSRLQKRGAKIIVLLSNLSNFEVQKALISQIRGVDIVIAGGSGEILANQGDLLVPGDKAAGKYPLTVSDADDRKVLLVSTAGSYLYLGRLSVGFTAGGEVAKIDRDKSGPLRVAHPSQEDGVGEAQDVAREVIAPLESGLDKMARESIARIQGSLDGVLRHVRSRETNLGDLVADSMLHAGRDAHRAGNSTRPDVAIFNGGAINNNSVLTGSITSLGVFSILPFPDFIVIVRKVPPTQIKEVLENAVSGVETFQGRFAQVSGLRYTFNPRGRAQRLDENGQVTVAGTRIVEVRLNDGRYLVRNGEVLENAPFLNVATLDYVAFGGDQYSFIERQIQSIGVTYQEAFSHYIQKLGTIRQADYPGVGRITRQN